jgi:hypothetical protein
VASSPAHSTGLSYHVIPDDPLRTLNILRQAAGLSPLPEDEDED